MDRSKLIGLFLSRKNRASKKELKSELTHTHVHKHTNMHEHTEREREREPHLEIFELIKYYLVRFTLFLNGPPITFAVFIVILFP